MATKSKSDWITIQSKRCVPQIEKAISNFNELACKRLIGLREATDKNNTTFKSKISQRDLAKIIGVQPQNYNKIKHGKINKGNNITLEQAIKLSIVYGCSIDYIALGKEPLNLDNEKINLIDELKTEQRLNKMLINENNHLKRIIAKKDGKF